MSDDIDDLRDRDRGEPPEEQLPRVPRSRAVSRRYGCYAETQQVSHPKSQDGSGHVTDVTDVTANRKGVYVAGVRKRACALAASIPTPLKHCNIRNIRNFPRAVGRFSVSHPAVTSASGVTLASGTGVLA